MRLFWGTSGVMTFVVLFCVLLLNERNPKSTRWKSDFMVGSILVPLITGVGLLGSVLIIQYLIAFNAATVSTKELAMTGAVAALGGLVLKFMKIKRRLARYRDQTEAAGAEVHHLVQTAGNPEPPVIGRKAA